MDIKIEKGVPYPQTNHHRIVYPFQEMEIGDSFVVENRKKISPSMAQYNKRHPEKRFSARTVNGVTRVWRIK